MFMNSLKKGLIACLAFMFAASAQSQEVLPTPRTKDVKVCANSPLLTGSLEAEVTTIPGYLDSDFELVWFKSKEEGSPEFSEIELSPYIQTAGVEGVYETVYTYYVLQRLKTNPMMQSAPAPVRVTVVSQPKITRLQTDPKCYGEEQDLNDMFGVDIVGSAYDYFNEAGELISDHIVKEPGIYEVRAYVKVDNFSDEVCSSPMEMLKVEFHQFDAEIEGPNVTCPGSGVELNASVMTRGGLKEKDVVYSWSNNLNANVGNANKYNTGSEGIINPGDIMKVTLEVSSAACQGDKAVKKSLAITVGNGPLIGNIKFSETNNTEFKAFQVSSNGIVFNSCGGSVNVELSRIVNTDGGLFSLTGSETSSGTFSNEISGDATLSLGAGKYMISYVNQCPTKFEFEIVDNSITSSSLNGSMTLCEGEPWSAEIVKIEGRTPPLIEWQKDGVVIPGETSTKLEIVSTKPSDSGVYSYSLFSAGCRFDSKTAMGIELTIKPYASFYESLFESSYEVPYGDSEEISVAVSESDIDVTWSDKNNGFSAVGTSVVIGPVETDYNFRVVADGKNYCRAETYIDVFVDAKIHLDATLDTNKITTGESAILTVDTIGTGRILHPNLYELTVTELSEGETKQIPLTVNPTTGKLEAEVSPTKNARYEVNCAYSSQKAYLALDLTVVESDGVKNIIADQNELVDVYNINGALLKKQVEFKDALVGLQSGVYMVNGVKLIVK